MSNFVLPSESQLLEKRYVNFTSYEDIKTATCEHIEATYSEFTPKAVCTELPDACIVEGRMNYVIKPISSTRFEVSSYFPKTSCRYGSTFWNYMESLHNDLCDYLYVKYETELKKHKLIEDYDNEEETTGLEGEPYYEKQFEDYLRLNPIESENLEADKVVTSNEVEEADESEGEDEDDLPPLGLATAESVARANEILTAYNNQKQENTLSIDEDIYVYDGIDIYE